MEIKTLKKVKILNNLSYQTFPITDDMVECDEKELSRIGIDKQFDNDGNIIDYINYDRKIEELKQRLVDTDYKALKYAEGELTAEEYAPIKQQRREWREEINLLEKLKGDEK